MCLQGRTFEPIALPRPASTWLIEPSVVPLPPGNIGYPALEEAGIPVDAQIEDACALMLFRTKAGVLFQSIGHGRECRQWTEPASINVRNPDSKVCASGFPAACCLSERATVSCCLHEKFSWASSQHLCLCLKPLRDAPAVPRDAPAVYEDGTSFLRLTVCMQMERLSYVLECVRICCKESGERPDSLPPPPPPPPPPPRGRVGRGGGGGGLPAIWLGSPLCNILKGYLNWAA